MSNNTLNLADLYNKTENSQCGNCNVLKLRKPFNCKKDYLNVKHVDVLFLSDCYGYSGFNSESMSNGEMEFFTDAIKPMLGSTSYAISPSVKCPTVKEQDLKADDMAICRTFLDETVKAYSPKLIIPLGNLAFKMLTKKSGISKYHGTEFNYDGIPVVPTYKLAIIFIEPKHLDFIIQDVKLALDKFIFGSAPKLNFEFSIIKSIDELKELIQAYNLDTTVTPIAMDVETQGLNFLNQHVLTFGFTFEHEGKHKSFCVPIRHKESPIDDYKELAKQINRITTNPLNIKILQNAKFDYKFLKLDLGIQLVYIYDTKGMAHLIDEYGSDSLKDLVKKYLPNTLETL